MSAAAAIPVITAAVTMAAKTDRPDLDFAEFPAPVEPPR